MQHKVHTFTKQHITLLDFDGVIYKNTKAHSLIARKITSFVQKTVKHLKTNEEASRVNTILYKTYGHTLIGLNKIGYNVNVHEFNDYVYGDLPYNDIAFQEDIHLPEHTFLFSNAPTEYCNKILKRKVANIREYIPSYCDTFFLKPEKKLYKQISQVFCNYSIVFVDDSMINLDPVLHSSQWVPVLYTSETNEIKKDIIPIGNVYCSMTYNPCELSKYLYDEISNV